MQMRCGPLLIASAIAFLISSEHAQAAASAGDLLNNCQSLERGKKGTGHLVKIPNTKEALICWGYMEAMQDLSVWVDENGHRIMGSCPSGQTTVLELIQAFVKYARSHRSELQDNAAVIVRMAFEEAFPCDRTLGTLG
jgi:hypothetical protein